MTKKGIILILLSLILVEVNCQTNFPAIRDNITLLPPNDKKAIAVALLISGDGGWNSFDNSIGKYLSQNNIGIAGLNARTYFWKKKTINEIIKDILPVITSCKQQWNTNKFILIGYSFGACIVPFIANALPESSKPVAVYCLSPSRTIDFEIHISDMLGIPGLKDKYDVLQEMKKLKSIPSFCFFGDEENHSLRDDFVETGAKITILPGNHHYNYNTILVAESILFEINNIR
ncbi:hypothetical protein A9168_12700 [Macellibacteroides sp. HH-ZS]|nr:hypothetical protein A9168_12700 [Macellibacteroides sp. HH-ZS]